MTEIINFEKRITQFFIISFKFSMAHPYIEGILNNLNDEEKKSILNYYQLYNAGSNENKSIVYLKGLFENNKTYTGSKNATDTIKSRIFDKSIDALVTEKHISNKNLHSDQDHLVFKLKKRLLHFRVLLKSLNQGRVNSLKSLLNGIINDAKKNEVYDVLIEALILKKYFIGIRSGSKEFEKTNKEISVYERHYKSVLFAGDSYYRVTLNNNLLKSYSKVEFRKYLTTILRKLKKDYTYTKSQQINYYMHLIFLIYNERNKKYGLAIKYCKQLIALINSSNVIYRKERIGFALDNLSQYKTFTGKFYDAAKYSKEAQSYYLENSYNFIASKGQEFHVYFYHQKYAKALKCSLELLDHSLSNAGKFRRSKFIYYQACASFALGNYKTALSLLNSSMEIEKDKSGWNIALRILIIMIFIEMDKIDEATTTLESLRKSIERTAKNGEVTPRDLLIVKLLREMEKNCFVLDDQNINITKMLQKLSLKEKPTSWEYYLPELIPFHNWVKAKIK